MPIISSRKREDFLEKLESAYLSDGIDCAKELCRMTKGQTPYIAYCILDMVKNNEINEATR